MKPIEEVSEPQITSPKDSSSDDNVSKYDDMDLSELFNELKPNKVESKSDFEKLQMRVNALPKIEANLTFKPIKAKDIININDPITIKRKKNDSEDSGKEWFNMKQPELTNDIKRDLLIIKNRSALDPKRHYKKEKWQIPKFFQMGTIIEGNTEFYTRLNKRQRGKNLVDEVLHDNDTQKYFKKRYAEIQRQKVSGGKNYYKKVKGMRKKF